MAILSTPTAPGGSTPGSFPENDDLEVTIRGGSVLAGDVVQLDLSASDAATTSSARGNAASIFANVVVPLAAGIKGVGACPIMAVCLAAADDDATCMVRLSGLVTAFVIKASGNIAIGDELTVSTSKNCTADGAEGDRIYAIAAVAATTPTVRTLKSVYFDGRGLGIKGTGSLVTTDGAQTLTGKTLSGASFSTTPTNDGFTQWAEVPIGTADVLALRTAAYPLVAAPGAGKMLELVGGVILLNYNTVAYAEDGGGSNLSIRYASGAGALASDTIEMTGFITQTADYATTFRPKVDAIASATDAENTALVLHNVGAGELITGDSDLEVRIAYRVWSTGF